MQHPSQGGTKEDAQPEVDEKDLNIQCLVYGLPVHSALVISQKQKQNPASGQNAGKNIGDQKFVHNKPEVLDEEYSTSLVDNFREKWESFQNLSLVEKGIAATTAAAIGAVGLYVGYCLFTAPNTLAAAPEVLVNLPSTVLGAFSWMGLTKLVVFDFTGEQEMGGLWRYLKEAAAIW